jgi:hypothetical protein
MTTSAQSSSNGRNRIPPDLQIDPLQGRALKNELTRQILDIEEKGGGMEDLMPLLTGQRSNRPGATAM